MAYAIKRTVEDGKSPYSCKNCGWKEMLENAIWDNSDDKPKCHICGCECKLEVEIVEADEAIGENDEE